MKPSKYNYYIPWKDGHQLVFNGLSRRFFFTSGNNAEAVKGLLEAPDGNDSQFDSFLERMRNEGFILNDDVDEMALVKELYDQKRLPGHYMLMIYPTYQCNLRCWYCTQDHRNVQMSPEVIERLKRHLDTYISDNDIKTLHLSWFGGEPMLRYDIIVGVNTFAKHLCEERGVQFSSSITTNATLLSEDRIKALSELGVNFYQITIDGWKEKHEKVKSLPNQSTFDLTMSNVRRILELAPSTECHLRINYDDTTLNAKRVVKDLNRYIPQELRPKLNIGPKKVWQVDERTFPNGYLSRFLNELKSEGFNANHQFFNMCYVNNYHFYTIYPDGSVGKCDNDTMENAKGRIGEDGRIAWQGTYPFVAFDHFKLRSECCQCKHFPMCFGPCPNTVDKMLTTTGKVICNCLNADAKIQFDITNIASSVRCHTPQ